MSSRHPSFDDIRHAAHGRWADLLPSLGVPAECLRDKHGPCPVCGGHDRFRFDDKEGRGTFICNSCGSGDGFDLAAKVRGVPVANIMRELADSLGVTGAISAHDKTTANARYQAQRKQAQEETARANGKAAEIARRLWERAALPPFAHPYLSTKGLDAIGVRLLRESGKPDTLLVPVRDAGGHLHSLQRIWAEAPDKFVKRHLKDGRKAGCFMLLGEPADTLLICEGYATGNSLHACTGLPVAVAFDAAGLLSVASTLRQQHPNMRLVIAADNDAFKPGNPGMTSAQRAAHASGATVIAPSFADHQGRLKDWNDLHQLDGKEAVALSVRRQLEVPVSTPAPPTECSPQKDGGGPFRVTDKGVYYFPPDEGDPVFVCEPLHLDAQTRDEAGANWGLWARFSDRDGREKGINLPREMVAADGGMEAMKLLLSLGLAVGPGRNARTRLLEYLQQANPVGRATLVSRLGWHTDAFMLPDATIGNSPEQLIFPCTGKPLNAASSKGTIDEWRRLVAAYCRENPRLIFAVSAAFAAPLLGLIGAPTFGFHFHGSSRCGKSTALHAAASVYGGHDYIQQWRATDNAVESLAAAYSDCLLPMDELGQCDARIVGDTVYMLGNGRGKARANDTGRMGKGPQTWRVLFLSNGELTLERKMQEAGKQIHAGMEMRMLAIPADAGAGLGIFDCLHDMPDGAALSRHLVSARDAQHGTAATAFLTMLVQERHDVASRITPYQAAFAQKHLESSDISGQVRDAASRFALVAFAGELASKWGITGWDAGEAVAAARVCFQAWLAARGGTGHQEELALLAQLRLFFERYGESRFTALSRVDDDHAARTIDRAGFWEVPSGSDDTVYYVMPEVFRRELCKGFDHKLAEALMIKMGALTPENASRPTRQKRISGYGKQRYYHVIASALAGSES